MPMKSEPYYWLECDGCQERADYDDFSAFSTQGQAIDTAIDGEWEQRGERFLCPDCRRSEAEDLAADAAT